jgi:N-acetyl-anhydromuramyl-L-alanine amidase AmpD
VEIIEKLRGLYKYIKMAKKRNMRKIDKIIIHCSATKSEQDIDAATIKEWHTRPKPMGNGWSDIGYHDVIKRDGRCEEGRPLTKIGAHTKGHNRYSIGICLVGGLSDNNEPISNFTNEQWKTLRRVVKIYRARFPNATVHGHNEFANKACPSFDVQAWLEEENI